MDSSENGITHTRDYRVALAKSRHPDLACIDAMHLFDMVDGKQSLGEDFGPHTVTAELFTIMLRKSVRANQPPLDPKPLIRIVSTKKEMFPDAMTAMVDEFPITEATVLKFVVLTLESVGYFKDKGSFLWGDQLLTKEEAINYGRE
jgi:hypothetical protein